MNMKNCKLDTYLECKSKVKFNRYLFCHSKNIIFNHLKLSVVTYVNICKKMLKYIIAFYRHL